MESTDAVNSRRTIRRFKSTPLPEEVTRNIFKLVRKAPSAGNAQPYRFVIVTDEDLKLKVANGCFTEKWIVEAPAIVVLCGLIDEAYPTLGGYMSSYPVDCGIALAHLMLACTNEGIGSGIVATFKEEKVREVLGLPSDTRVVAVVPIGYPDEEPEVSPRKHMSELVNYNKYDY